MNITDHIQNDDQRGDYRWWENTVKLERLRAAFSMGCDINEACLYAEISRDQYDYYAYKINPDYGKMTKLWRQKPILLARQSVVKALSSNPELALKYLERKKRDEFAVRQDITSDDKKIEHPILYIPEEKR